MDDSQNTEKEINNDNEQLKKINPLPDPTTPIDHTKKKKSHNRATSYGFYEEVKNLRANREIEKIDSVPFPDDKSELMYRWWTRYPYSLRPMDSLATEFEVSVTEVMRIRERDRWQERYDLLMSHIDEHVRKEVIIRRPLAIQEFMSDTQEILDVMATSVKNLASGGGKVEIKNIDDLVKVTKAMRELHNARLNILMFEGKKLNKTVITEIMAQASNEEMDIHDIMQAFEERGLDIPKYVASKAQAEMGKDAGDTASDLTFNIDLSTAPKNTKT